MNVDRLEKQIQFIIEIDKLKAVVRHTLLTDASRRENSAEHSWHLAVMALLLCEHSKDQDIDLLKVLKMLLIHDIVEVYAGDTYCYDEAGYQDKAKREQMAADRLFGMLPPDQEKDFRSLWNEFETCDSTEARFAAGLDRLQPLLNNFMTGGEIWRKNGIRSSQVIARNQLMENGSPALWEYASRKIREAVEKGMLAE